MKGSFTLDLVGVNSMFSCPVQVVPVPRCRCILHACKISCVLEPVGFKAPSFSTDAVSTSYIRIVGQSFGILCQAQAHPVPIFR